MNASRRLYKSHAILHTASIDVKVLRIDKRQMTMGVFRQLPESPVVDTGFCLNGQMWGIVRYTWKETPQWATAYVVWEHEGTLYKSPIVTNWKECEELILIDDKYLNQRMEGLTGYYDPPCGGIPMQEMARVVSKGPTSKCGMYEWIENVFNFIQMIEQLDQLFIAV